VFGQGNVEGDKNYDEWVFINKETLNLITLYDYKQTSVYGEDLLTPYEFCNSNADDRLHIRGKCHDVNEVDEFVKFIIKSTSNIREFHETICFMKFDDPKRTLLII